MVVTFVKSSGDRRYYYTLHDYQISLFSRYSLTVIWGPYIETGRRKVYTFDTKQQLDAKLRSLVRRRFSLGYTLLYSYSRSEKYRDLFSKGDTSEKKTKYAY
jgi:predicted DNA-binding WGR domain protein